ncbi:MAG: hypothetical protein HKN43_00270, partial [Rhodothermales bacterium]|nr:hypothetical protein [Rhodothermales bacterium]
MIFSKSIQTHFISGILTLLVGISAIGNSAIAQPVVSNVDIVTTDSSATIAFDTDVATTALIDYGLTTGYGSKDSSIVFATSHSFLIDSLAENTLYHFQITVDDVLLNQTVTPDSTFMTNDVTGPQISNLMIVTTDSSATLTFDTDEPATSVIDWGLSAAYDSTQADTNLVTSHSIVLDSLAENTLYHFALTVEDSLSNQTITADSTFRTDDVTAPVISNLVIVTTDSSATLTFDTDEPATSVIDYGLTAAYDSTQSDTNLVTSHTVVVDSLLSGTEYHFALTVADSSANQTVTSDSTFMTDDVPGPQISNLIIVTTDSSATLTFDTDEPATSVIDWGLSASYDSTQADTNLVTSHTIVLD